MASSKREFLVLEPEMFYRSFPHLNPKNQCADGSYEKGVQKVAIFVNGGEPVHIAIQPPYRNGIWKSKTQYNIDMEHKSLEILETWPEDDPERQGYGKAVTFMRLRRVRKKMPVIRERR